MEKHDLYRSVVPWICT